MPGVIQTLFGLSVPHGRLPECIASLQDAMRAMKETPYHPVVDLDFLHHLDDASQLIVDFYHACSEKRPLGAMYFEMNGFTVNPDRWYFNGFGYNQSGDIWDLTWNTDCLNPWDAETEDFTLTGMKTVQSAFADLYCDDQQPLSVQVAGEVAEHLIVARLRELICAAHRVAKESCPNLEGFPILSTAHEWDMLCPSQ